MNESTNSKQLVLIWCAVIIAFFGSIIALAKFSGGPGKGGEQAANYDATYTGAIPALFKVDQNDHYRGGKEAKVVLVEYSDLECPYCKVYASVMQELHRNYGDKVALVYRHYPLSLATAGRVHPSSMLAAQATEAASAQGKFWEMHDKIFEQQEEWTGNANVRGLFVGYAKALGLNEEQFGKDLDSTELRQRVLAAYKSGEEAKVDSTPTFFLNGKKVENPNGVEGLKTAIDAALAETSK